ncbi:hypothetical protein B0H13DRAFT_2651676, partial [Mycena leptocephala]
MNLSHYDTQPPSVNDTIFRCPKRGCCRRIQLRRATSGTHKGQEYPKCYNPNHEDLIPAFWFLSTCPRCCQQYCSLHSCSRFNDLPLVLHQSEIPNKYMLPTLNPKPECSYISHRIRSPCSAGHQILCIRRFYPPCCRAHQTTNNSTPTETPCLSAICSLPPPSPSLARECDNQHVL